MAEKKMMHLIESMRIHNDNSVEELTLVASLLKANSILTNLDISWCGNIGEEKARSNLLSCLAINSTLIRLNFEASELEDTELKEFTKCLIRNSTLTSLNLPHNHIKDEGANELASSLKINSTLTFLNLQFNHIKDEGAKELSSCLKINSTLTFLDLGYNTIGPEGATELSSCLMINSTLNCLDLEGNNIKDEGAKELASCLKINSTLISLNLGHNKIGPEGSKELSSCLKINSTLTHLNLLGNYIGDEGIKELSASLDINTSILYLGFTSYSQHVGGIDAVGMRLLGEVECKLDNNSKKMVIRKGNLIRCLIILGRNRLINSHVNHGNLSALPLDILMYLTKFFHFSDFGIGVSMVSAWMKEAITNAHLPFDDVFKKK